MRHRGHVAMRVVGIRFWSAAAKDGATQPIALLTSFEEARLVVDIAARPVTVCRLMAQLQEIAHRVIVVPLGIAPHGLTVLRMRERDTELVVPGSFQAVRLAQCAHVPLPSASDRWHRRYSQREASPPGY